MDVQSVLIGALLMDDQLAPYSLPELSIEHFRPELQPTFAAVQGFWITKGLLDIMQIAAKYPDQKQNLLSCVASCESECIRLTRDRVEEWTRIIMEDAAKARFQSLAFRAVDAATAFDDLPDLYQQMGQALDIHTEKNDFQSVGDLLDDYIRHLDEKPAPRARQLFRDRRQTQRGQDRSEPPACCRDGKAGQAGVLFLAGNRPGHIAGPSDCQPAVCSSLGGQK